MHCITLSVTVQWKVCFLWTSSGVRCCSSGCRRCAHLQEEKKEEELTWPADSTPRSIWWTVTANLSHSSLFHFLCVLQTCGVLLDPETLILVSSDQTSVSQACLNVLQLTLNTLQHAFSFSYVWWTCIQVMVEWITCVFFETIAPAGP